MAKSAARICIVGTGWRAEFYIRICMACPERFSLAGIWYHSEKGKQSVSQFGAPLFSSLEEVAHAKPDYAVVSLNGKAMVEALDYLTACGIPCLAETFMLADEVEISKAAKALQGRKIQIAEQYAYQPLNAARLKLARTGALGDVFHLRMSIPTRHHSASLVRLFLNTGDRLPRIRAERYSHRVIRGPGRAGDPKEEGYFDAFHEIVTYDYGEKQAVNDFEDMQHRSFMRSNYFLVRGSRGEIVNEHVKYMKDYMTPVEYELKREMAGAGVDLQGMFLRGVTGGQEGWLYYNPFLPARLYDDELAVAHCMLRMAEYAQGGTPFYAFEDALTDMYYALLTEKAVQTGEWIKVQKKSWMA